MVGMSEFAIPQGETTPSLKERIKGFLDQVGRAAMVGAEEQLGIPRELRSSVSPTEARRVIVGSQISPGEKPVVYGEPPDVVADISDGEIEQFGL